MNNKTENLLIQEPLRMRNILSKILEKITPTEQENKAINNLVNIISSACLESAKTNSIPLIDVIHVGSSSRDTHLRGDTDIDLFLRFKARSKEEIELYLKKLATIIEQKLSVSIIWKYSENPYMFFTIWDQNMMFEVDLVGIIYISSPNELSRALTIGGMARTPFHTWYLNKKLTPCLKASARIFKYWLKLKKCYGAGGITGFLAELLILHHQGFANCLQILAQNSLRNYYLDIEKHYTSLDALKEKFPRDVCIIVDPIDPNRNAAGGIQGFYSKFLLTRLQNEARKTLDNPSKELTREVVPEVGWIKISIEFTISPKNEDEQFFRIARLARILTAPLDKQGFHLQDVLINGRKKQLFLKFKEIRVPFFEKKGPPLSLKEEVKKFKIKNHDTFEREGRIWARVKNTPDDVLFWINQNYNKMKHQIEAKIKTEIVR